MARTLTPAEKRFIVRGLAMRQGPSRVAVEFTKHYKKPMIRTTVHRYDPETVYGNQLSQELKDYFYKTRADFDERQTEDELFNRMGRANAKKRRVESLYRIIEERAAAGMNPDGSEVYPGSSEGIQAQDRFGQVAFESAIFAEIRALEVEIAKELGQWSEKTDITSGGQPFKALIGIDIDQI